MGENHAKSGPSANDILDGLSTAVLVIDRALNVVRSNSAAQQLLSMSDGRLCGSYLLQHVHFPAEFVQRLQTPTTGGSDLIEREMVILVPHSQREVCVDCAVITIGGHTAEGYRLLEFIDRIQPARANKEAMLLAQQDASQLLLRQLAHEIKNPLGGMRGAAQLLESELPDPSLTEYTRIIVNEADRLHALIERMSGPNSGGELAPINIHNALENTRQLLLSQADTDINIECDYDPSIPPVLADRHWLEQVILNVAQNAVQAAISHPQIVFKTRIRHALTIRKTRHKLVASVEISDNGPGIPEDLRDTLFYPMVSGRDDGSGLGLAIAQGLVTRMGGLIEFDSAPGRTTFSIYLPLAPERRNEQR